MSHDRYSARIREPADGLTVTLNRILLYLCAALLLGALTGCGRRGPLELPPETQARGQMLKAQDEATQTKAARGAKAPAPGEEDPKRPPPPIPGTVGNRPPDQYPFPLDPLL